MIESLTTVFNNLTAFNVALLTFVPSVVGVASFIAKFLPPPEKPGIGAKVHKWINWIGQNSGYAENKQ